MKTAFLLTFLTAASARAGDAPTEFQSARITVSSTATVEQHRFRESSKEVPAPGTVMDVYVWREAGDAPVAAGGRAEFTISLVEDIFEISVPREAVIVTGNGPMRIRSADIRSLEALSAPLNGRRSSMVMPVAQRDAVLLRSGPPKFTCSLGRDSAAERVLLSWKKGGPSFKKVCVDDPAKPPRAPAKAIEALSKMAGTVILEFMDDERPDH